ncbi:melanoma-associated antigen B10-like [Ochotona curzoniae]|uniref:melanoma-associated antigen B10-like n=1 Tax=Ochotona curzoniae TaxID=130825 RepID=UPI001B34DBE4|nr:melanoma-associated antigen B10-like [Ochotona curzoniae]
MPRGQKSKLRARAKRRQAQEQLQNVMGVPAMAGVEEPACSPSSTCVSEAPKSSATSEATSSPQEPPRAPRTNTAVPVSYARSNNRARGRPRSSRVQSAFEYHTKGPVDKAVILLVQYLLRKYQMREPVSKADILKKVTGLPNSYFHEILMKASEYMELIFGLDIKKLDLNRHIYILINKLEIGYDENLDDNGRIPITGLLMTILAVIFTRGNCATEEQIWQLLNLMGLYAGKKHFLFGEPQKLITIDLVKAKYLEYQQVPNSIPPCYQFLWGPRAHAETSKMKVLEFLAKAHNTVPTAFTFWYQEALKDEEERALARVMARARIKAMADARLRVCTSSLPKTSRI